MLNGILNLNNLFIYGVCLVFGIGLIIEIFLTVNYYRETAKRAKETSENRDLSIFNKGNTRSPLHFVPTLLTALGILGTFWGIFRGLDGIDLNSINNTDILLTNSAELLVGMKTAFQSSLWGLGGGSLFILLLAVTEGLKRDRRNHFIKKLRNAETHKTTQDFIDQLGNIADKMEELGTLNARNIGEEIAIALNPSFQAVRNDLNTQNQTLQTFVTLKPKTIGEAVATALKPPLEDIKTDLNIQYQELLETLIKELQTEVIEPVVNRLDESTNLTKEASTTVNDLRKQLGGISESLATSIQTIQQFQQETLGQLETFAQHLQEILNQFKTDTQGIMQQMTTDIHNAVNESISGMESQRAAFAESAEETAQTFQRIREDLQAALNTQARQQQAMLEDVQSSTESILQEANNAFVEQSNTLSRVGNEASEMMNNASHNLTGTLINVDAMLQNTRQTVQEESEQFRTDYQDSLNQFFEQQNHLLGETLGKQREGLEAVVKDLQKVFQEDAINMAKQVIASMEKIETTTKSVNHLANTTGLTAAERLAQIQEIARTLGNESEKINQAYESLIYQFNQGLDIWNQSLTQYFEQANETYQQGRQESEQAAAEVCNQLHETSQGLMSVASYLVAAANDLNNANSNV